MHENGCGCGPSGRVSMFVYDLDRRLSGPHVCCHETLTSSWHHSLTAFLLFSIFHLCFTSFLPLYHSFFLLLLLMSVSQSSPLSPCFSSALSNLSLCQCVIFFSSRSSHRVSRRPSSYSSSCFGPLFPLFLLLRLFSSLLWPMDTWEVTSSRLCTQQECSNPPSHWPATGHSVTICMEERWTHWMFCFLWQRLKSNKPWWIFIYVLF